MGFCQIQIRKIISAFSEFQIPALNQTCSLFILYFGGYYEVYFLKNHIDMLLVKHNYFKTRFQFLQNV